IHRSICDINLPCCDFQTGKATLIVAVPDTTFCWEIDMWTVVGSTLQLFFSAVSKCAVSVMGRSRSTNCTKFTSYAHMPNFLAGTEVVFANAAIASWAQPSNSSIPGT